jgi:hypothetical protein
MARSKQEHPGDAEGAFGQEKSKPSTTPSGATPASTPSPGQSKSEPPEEKTG